MKRRFELTSDNKIYDIAYKDLLTGQQIVDLLNSLDFKDAGGNFVEKYIPLTTEYIIKYGILVDYGPLNGPYTRRGFTNRKEYLLSLSKKYNVPQEIVLALAGVLYRSEDFDGLITAIEIYKHLFDEEIKKNTKK